MKKYVVGELIKHRYSNEIGIIKVQRIDQFKQQLLTVKWEDGEVTKDFFANIAKPLRPFRKTFIKKEKYETN